MEGFLFSFQLGRGGSSFGRPDRCWLLFLSEASKGRVLADAGFCGARSASVFSWFFFFFGSRMPAAEQHVLEARDFVFFHVWFSRVGF